VSGFVAGIERCGSRICSDLALHSPVRTGSVSASLAAPTTDHDVCLKRARENIRPTMMLSGSPQHARPLGPGFSFLAHADGVQKDSACRKSVLVREDEAADGPFPK
jgi:hypothetical protein